MASRWAAAAFVVVFAPALHAAEPDELRDAVKQILDAGWNPQPAAYADVEKHHSAASALAPGDARVQYALFLAQLKHHRYREAQQTIARLVESNPEDWTAWQGKIWLAVLTKRFNAALADMDEATQLMPPLEAAGTVERPVTELCQLMGRIMAFLEGPAARSVPGDSLADYQRRILERLTTERRSAYEAGYRGVRERFAELQLAKLDTRTEAKEQKERMQAQDRERLAAEKESVEQQQKSVDEQAAAAREVAQTAVADVDRRKAPLDARLAQLNVAVAALQAELVAVDAQIFQLEQLALQTNDPVLRAQYRAEAAALAATQIGRQARYAAVAAEGTQVTTQLAALENERRGVLARYQSEMQRLGRRAEQLFTTTRRIAAEERVASKPATGTTGTVIALGDSATALTTYHPFPFDRERQRLIASFR